MYQAILQQLKYLYISSLFFVISLKN